MMAIFSDWSHVTIICYNDLIFLPVLKTLSDKNVEYLELK